MSDLFGDDPAPARPAKKAPAAPVRKPTKRELREAAPPPRNRAPVKPQAPAGESEDAELHGLVRLLAGADMLAPEELEKYSEVVEPVISKTSRDEMKNWREEHAQHGHKNGI